MRVILLCGYRTGEDVALGLERNSSGVTLIDRRIIELTSRGFEVICVLSRNSADEILRESRQLPEVEIVYDTHGDDANLATNLKSGLAATDGEGCFAIPLEIPVPPPELWAFIREAWRRQGFHTDTSVFQIAQGAPRHYGFPLLISRKGNALIRSLKGFENLVDARLKYQHLAFSKEATLAPTEKPL